MDTTRNWYAKPLDRSLPQLQIEGTVPLLVVQALDDDICSPRHAQRIASTVRGPCRVVYLENSYHLVHLDQERREVARVTAEFMRDQAADRNDINRRIVE